MASIAIRTRVRRWVSTHRKLARLPSELRTASTSVDIAGRREAVQKEPRLQKQASNDPATPKGEQN
jgi:hypothetical protein